MDAFHHDTALRLSGRQHRHLAPLAGNIVQDSGVRLLLLELPGPLLQHLIDDLAFF